MDLKSEFSWGEKNPAGAVGRQGWNSGGIPGIFGVKSEVFGVSRDLPPPAHPSPSPLLFPAPENLGIPRKMPKKSCLGLSFHRNSLFLLLVWFILFFFPPLVFLSLLPSPNSWNSRNSRSQRFRIHPHVMEAPGKERGGGGAGKILTPKLPKS